MGEGEGSADCARAIALGNCVQPGWAGADFECLLHADGVMGQWNACAVMAATALQCAVHKKRGGGCSGARGGAFTCHACKKLGVLEGWFFRLKLSSSEYNTCAFAEHH